MSRRLIQLREQIELEVVLSKSIRMIVKMKNLYELSFLLGGASLFGVFFGRRE